jgi:hypothetical protein
MAIQFQDIQAPSEGIDSTIPTVTVLAVENSQIPEASIETARSIQKTHIQGTRVTVRVTVMHHEDNLVP